MLDLQRGRFGSNEKKKKVHHGYCVPCVPPDGKTRSPADSSNGH